MPHPVNACLMAALLTSVSMLAAASEINILGTPPATAVAGVPYNWAPKVANANLPDLQFAYVNKPSWSGNYRGSGAIIGTPTQPGVYRGIQIEAWDGVNFGKSAPFTITVAPAAASSTGSVNLRWMKPSHNTDGSALTNLAGYVIRYGTSAAHLNTQLLIQSPNSTAAEVGNLAPGIWYFEIAAVTDENVHGAFSPIAHDSTR
jgi:hypothetical protein